MRMVLPSWLPSIGGFDELIDDVDDDNGDECLELQTLQPIFIL